MHQIERCTTKDIVLLEKARMVSVVPNTIRAHVIFYILEYKALALFI